MADGLRLLEQRLRTAKLPVMFVGSHGCVEWERRLTKEEAELYRSLSKGIRPLLTAQQCRVLSLASHGYSNQQIANKLGVEEQTIKNTFTTIFSRLNVNDRAHAVATALRDGMIK